MTEQIIKTLAQAQFSAMKFIEKYDSGKAISVETYNDMRALNAMIWSLRHEDKDLDAQILELLKHFEFAHRE